jgi:hypothetical protein
MKWVLASFFILFLFAGTGDVPAQIFVPLQNYGGHLAANSARLSPIDNKLDVCGHRRGCIFRRTSPTKLASKVAFQASYNGIGLVNELGYRGRAQTNVEKLFSPVVYGIFMGAVGPLSI